MKRESLVKLIIGEGSVFFIFALLMSRLPLMISSVFSFPFEQIAIGLKHLSNMGKLGNGLAIALWVGVSLFPLIFALKSKAGEMENSAQKILAYVFSFLLFLSLYAMINPEFLSSSILNGKIKLHSMLIHSAIGASLWSLIVLCYVFRLIQIVRLGDQKSLLKHIRIMLHVLCLLFMGGAVISFVNGLISSFQMQMPIPDKSFSIMRLIVVCLPKVFYVWIIAQAFMLIDSFANVKDNMEDCTKKLRSVCITSLLSMVALNTGFNFVQLYFIRSLSHFQISVELPVIDIVFIALVLLLCKLLLENKELRDENNLFV